MSYGGFAHTSRSVTERVYWRRQQSIASRATSPGTVSERIAFLADPLKDLHGPGRVISLLTSYLGDDFDLRVASPSVSPGVRAELEGRGIEVVDLGRRYHARSSSFCFAEAWGRETLFQANRKAWAQHALPEEHVVNFSQTIAAPSEVWYLLGAVSPAIRDIAPSLPFGLREGVRAMLPFAAWLDTNLIDMVAPTCSQILAASRYTGTTYAPWNVRVDGVLYPPLDTGVYRPTRPYPEESYVLAYLGKEVDYRPIVAIAEAGIPVRIFGSKVTSLPQEVRSHPRIEVLRFVSEAELAELYTHARFTIFPFMTEPFGYVPVESMACGTPVLTYGRHGPSETVIDGRTGWFCDGREAFVRQALALWEAGQIAPSVRRACVDRAQSFSVSRVGEQWRGVLRGISSEAPSCMPTRVRPRPLAIGSGPALEAAPQPVGS